MDDQKKSDCLAAYANFSVGEKVMYLVAGKRFQKVAAIANIYRHLLSPKCVVFELAFDDESLPQHLKSQPVTFPQNASWIGKLDF